MKFTRTPINESNRGVQILHVIADYGR